MKFQNAQKKAKRIYLPLKADKNEQKTAEFINCSYKDRQVVCREGFDCDLYNPIYRSDFSPYTENELVLTECYLYIRGKYGRVAVSKADNLMGSVIFFMKIVFIDGEVLDIGSIEFNRVTFDAFGYPDSFTVFSGKATKGCGIYFISRQIYGNGYEDFVRVMELDKDMENWILLDDSEIYAPVLLVNGRGESYFFSSTYGVYLDLPDPISLQSRNLLNGRFISYYTSDHASTAFTLPLSELDNSLVKCSFEQSGEITEWKIFADAENSDPVLFEGQQIVMLCDRQKGRVYFKTADGVDFAFAYTGQPNNIKIEAYKTTPADKIKVASMNVCHPLPSDSGKTENKVSAFYGGYLHPSTVLFNSPKNPLYFPQSSQYSLGENEKGITKILFKEQNILAFKGNGLFSASVEAIEDLGELNLNAEIKKTPDSYNLKFKKTMDFTCEPIPKSIEKLGSDIVFVNTNREIFKLTKAGKVEKIGKTKTDADGFGISCGNRYIYFYGEGATVVEDESVSSWELPSNMVGGFAYLDKLILFSSIYENGVYILYPVWVSGNLDRKIIISDTLAEKIESEITAECSFYPFKKEDGCVKISKIRIDGQTDNITVTLSDKEGRRQKSRIGLYKGKKVFTNGFSGYNPKLTLNFSSGKIEGVAVEYHTLNIF